MLKASHVSEKAHQIKQIIISNQEEIINTLLKYESFQVAEYEISRVLNTLDNIDVNSKYLEDTVENISVFMPSNLPFYSLVLFGVIPGFQSSGKVFVKPNQEMREKLIIEDLYKILELDNILPNIIILNLDSFRFIDEYVKTSELVIFTGYHKNKEKILKELSNNSLMIFNGSGHNPIVISEDADLTKAVKDTIFTRFFNTGQDCAGPDAILVHRSIFQQFLNEFVNEVRKLKIDNNYISRENEIGPINRLSELQKFLNIIFNVPQQKIIEGGTIDVTNRIISPTVIATHLTEFINWNEVFGPIAFIHEYENDDQLKYYFEDKNGSYLRNKMYVSLYGTSNYVLTRNDENLPKKNGIGIVLHNQTIHDYERGYKPYGGFSLGASSVIIKHSTNKIQSFAQPIYIPSVISFFVKNKNRNDYNSKNKLQKFIIKEFIRKTHEVFGTNLIFAFIFGSFAKQNARFKTTNASDLDTFICLQNKNPEQIQIYNRWIIQFQWKIGLKPDLDYPSEIVTINDLEENFNAATSKILNSSLNNEEIFDSIIWVNALKFNKVGVIGDKKALSKFNQVANNIWEHFYKNIILEFKNEKIPNKKSIEDGLIKEKKDYDIFKQNLNNVKPRNLTFFIQDYVPLGSREIKTSQDDQLYSEKNYYLKKP